MSYLYTVLWKNWVGILLAIDAVIALGERYLGDYLEKRFHLEIKVPKEIKWGFAILVLMIAQGVAYHDLQTDMQNLESQSKVLNGLKEQLQQRNSDLSSLIISKDRPIILQIVPDPEIQKMFKRQDEELRQLKQELPSRRKKALELSNDMIRFVQNVIKNQPAPPNPRIEENLQSRVDQYIKDFTQWMSNSSAEYQGKFAGRLASLQEDAKSAGLSVDEIVACQSSNGNPSGIEKCAASVGAIADKLPR